MNDFYTNMTSEDKSHLHEIKFSLNKVMENIHSVAEYKGNCPTTKKLDDQLTEIHKMAESLMIEIRKETAV